MSLMDLIFYLANLAGSFLACWYALCGLNACTRRTPFATRLSFAAIAIGGFAQALHPPEIDAGGVASVLVVCGLAVGFVANRKKCVCLNCPARAGIRHPAPIHHDEGIAA
jgi:hypothetical protein